MILTTVMLWVMTAFTVDAKALLREVMATLAQLSLSAICWNAQTWLTNLTSRWLSRVKSNKSK